MNFINIFNTAIIAILLVPNIIYAVKFRKIKNLCTNRAMNILEHIGRIACIVFMVFPLFAGEFGFSNVEYFIVYLFGNAVFLLAYIVLWFRFFKKQSNTKALLLAVLPVMIFLLCGITLEHWLLIFAAVLFGVGHIYVTAANFIKKLENKGKYAQENEDKTLSRNENSEVKD